MGPTSASTRQQLEEELLSACLELLNIKQADGAKLVDVSPGMFRKPNARALELILYHAYCVVKGRVAAKKVCVGMLLADQECTADPASVVRDSLPVAQTTASSWCCHAAAARTCGACGLLWTRTASRAKSSTR